MKKIYCFVLVLIVTSLVFSIGMADARTRDFDFGNFERFIEKTGIKTRLGQFGLGNTDVELLVEKGFAPNMALNPRKVEKEDLRRILTELL